MKPIYLLTSLFAFLITTTAFSQKLVTLTVTGVPGLTGQTNLTSVQFGASNQYSPTGGSGVGRAAFTPITVTKVVDEAFSAVFMEYLATGRIIATGELVAYGETNQPIYKIELKELVVTNFSTSVVPNCPNGCSGLAESYQFEYTAIRVTTYKPDGQVGRIFSFNRRTNTTTF